MSRPPGSPAPSQLPSDHRLGPAPAGEPYAAVRETHTSVVIVIGNRVYKVKKAVKLPFIDLSTRADRVANCLDEVRLNRRIAPDVYLGVDELRELEGRTGDAGEPVVVMRRMPDARRLATLVRDPATSAAARECVLGVARQVAAFHASLPPVAAYDIATTMADLWREGREQTVPFEDGPLDRDLLDETYALAADYLAGRAGLLGERGQAGLVRDGHGDLLADDIFLLDDGVRVLDCLEFDERLRLGDVLLDIAFLAMDLALLDAPELARLLVQRYRELSAETHPRSLEDHYVAYRAWVRAKVECLRSRGGDPGAADRAVAAQRQSLLAARAARIHLLLVGGLPGSGKSTLAETIAERDDRDWIVLSSDVIRKQLAGISPLTSAAAGYAQGAYDAGHTEATYDEMLRLAATALEHGVNVVLDASWSDADHRARAAALARGHHATITSIRSTAPPDICLQRLGARAGGPHVSDADADVFAHMADGFAPWPEAQHVDTAGAVEDAASAVQRALQDAPFTPDRR